MSHQIITFGDLITTDSIVAAMAIYDAMDITAILKSDNKVISSKVMS